ncbi:hypothetical protein PC117_g24051 [Phytophthora cactorum]|uniref:No apical meristem-associated C-terminal domain-containing protein n=1 Tax=Phytophthora cactorum TaxID=29920 RepID=A0A8T1AZR6_9STRA|nr:hypothetical protein PC117_g24051 [Phytophthora cactorum]
MEGAGRRENVPPHDPDGGSWRSDLSDLQSTCPHFKRGSQPNDHSGASIGKNTTELGTQVGTVWEPVGLGTGAQRSARYESMDGKLARGHNYDLSWARARDHVTSDASVGTDQKAAMFWTRVKAEMESSVPIAKALEINSLKPRSWSSLQSHFGQASKAISKFVRCCKKVDAIGQSGTNEKDMIEKSYLLFKTEYKRRFQYIDCYNELADCPKFEKILGRGTKHHAETSDDSSDPNGADGPSSRTSADTDRRMVRRRQKGLRLLKKWSKRSLARAWRPRNAAFHSSPAPPLSDREDASATVGQSPDQIVASSPTVVNPISIADLCFQTDN